MASARNEAPKFSKLDKLNTSNFVQWREDLISELMLNNLDHYLSHVPIPDSDARRQVYGTEIKYVTSLIRKSVELEFIDIVDRNRTEPWTTMTELGQTCLNRSEEGISLLKSILYRMKLTDYGDVNSFLSSLRTTLVDLANQQVPLSDKEKLTILLNALPPSFQVFKLVCQSNENLTFPLACHKLIAFTEDQMPKTPKVKNDSAFKAGKFMRKLANVKCHACNKFGHVAKYCKNKKMSQSPSKTKFFKRRNKHMSNNTYQADNDTDSDDDDLSSLLQDLNVQHDSEDESDRESQQPGTVYASFDTSGLILDSGCS